MRGSDRKRAKQGKAEKAAKLASFAQWSEDVNAQWQCVADYFGQSMQVPGGGQWVREEMRAKGWNFPR